MFFSSFISEQSQFTVFLSCVLFLRLLAEQSQFTAFLSVFYF